MMIMQTSNNDDGSNTSRNVSASTAKYRRPRKELFPSNVALNPGPTFRIMASSPGNGSFLRNYTTSQAPGSRPERDTVDFPIYIYIYIYI